MRCYVYAEGERERAVERHCLLRASCCIRRRPPSANESSVESDLDFFITGALRRPEGEGQASYRLRHVAHDLAGLAFSPVVGTSGDRDQLIIPKRPC